jgi:hypothetical protein
MVTMRQKSSLLQVARSVSQALTPDIYLYDKPYEDKKTVRVAGPFTVESLSPHRVLGVDANDELTDALKEDGAEYGAKQSKSAATEPKASPAGSSIPITMRKALRPPRLTRMSSSAWRIRRRSLRNSRKWFNCAVSMGFVFSCTKPPSTSLSGIKTLRAENLSKQGQKVRATYGYYKAGSRLLI